MVISDNTVRILENNVVNVLIEVFHKDSRTANKLVREADLGGFIRKHPIAMHSGCHDFALQILTSVKDYDSIIKYS